MKNEVELLQGEGLRADTGSLAQPEAQPFETFESEGKLWHGVGILEFWWRGYTAPQSGGWQDPPLLTPEFEEWLRERDCGVRECIVGPPHIVFPTAQAADQFRVHWHEPGEAQRLHYFSWCSDSSNREPTTTATMEAAMVRAYAAAQTLREQRS